MIFFTTFQSVPGSKKARHGAEQKFVLFRVTFIKKYESTNFFFEFFLFRHSHVPLTGVGIKWKSGVLDIVLLFDLQIILILIQIHQNENTIQYCIQYCINTVIIQIMAVEPLNRKIQ